MKKKNIQQLLREPSFFPQEMIDFYSSRAFHVHDYLPPICNSCEGLSLTMPVSMRLERVVMTVALAGMFTPAASVSVANTT